MPKLGGGEIPPPTVTQDKKAQAQANAAKLIAALSTDNVKPENTRTDNFAKKHLAFYLVNGNEKQRYDYDSLSKGFDAFVNAGILKQNDPTKQSKTSILRAYLKKQVKAGAIEMITPQLEPKGATSVK